LSSGFTKIQRLELIAKQFPLLKSEALSMAIKLLQDTGNAKELDALRNKFSSIAVDMAWFNNAIISGNREEARLEQEFERARNEVVKENTRMAAINQGDYHYNMGHYSLSLNMYSKSRDYCSNASHNLTTILKLLKASVSVQKYHNVCNLYIRAMSLLPVLDPITISQLNSIQGISHMCLGNFEHALESFSKVGIELGNTLNDVVACEDIALYGVLCMLACKSRDTVTSRVAQNASFKALLESNYLARELMHDFANVKYAECLDHLAVLEKHAAADIFLFQTYVTMFSDIRTAILVQYILPFSVVDLNRMALAFKISPKDLEEQLAKLIGSKVLTAKIDSNTGFLIISTEDERSASFLKAIQVGKKFCADTRNTMLHMSMNQGKFGSSTRPVKPIGNTQDYFASDDGASEMEVDDYEQNASQSSI